MFPVLVERQAADGSFFVALEFDGGLGDKVLKPIFGGLEDWEGGLAGELGEILWNVSWPS